MVQKVYAQIDTTVVSVINPQFQNFGDIFGFAINVTLGVGWSLVFIMIALGFVQYILSRGEKSAVDAAQRWLTYAVIGGIGLFFVSFFRGAISRLITGDPNIGPTRNIQEFDISS